MRIEKYIPGTKGTTITHHGKEYVLDENIHYHIDIDPSEEDTPYPISLSAQLRDPDMLLEACWSVFSDDLEEWTKNFDFNTNLDGIIETEFD